jgi:hypothetical protein
MALKLLRNTNFGLNNVSPSCSNFSHLWHPQSMSLALIALGCEPVIRTPFAGFEIIFLNNKGNFNKRWHLCSSITICTSFSKICLLSSLLLYHFIIISRSYYWNKSCPIINVWVVSSDIVLKCAGVVILTGDRRGKCVNFCQNYSSRSLWWKSSWCSACVEI